MKIAICVGSDLYMITRDNFVLHMKVVVQACECYLCKEFRNAQLPFNMKMQISRSLNMNCLYFRSHGHGSTWDATRSRTASLQKPRS